MTYNKQPRNFSLKFTLGQKLLILFLAVALLPLTVSAGIAYQNIHNFVMSDVGAQLRGTAAIQSERVDEIINGYLDRTKLVAARKGFVNSLYPVLQPTAANLQTINTTLSDTQQSISGIQSIAILTIGGKVIASTDTSTVGFNEQRMTYYRKGLIKTNFDGLFIGQDGSKLARTSSPLMSGKKTVGVITVVFNENLLQSVTSDHTGLGKTGEVILARNIPGTDTVQYLNPPRFNSSLFLQQAANSSPMHTIIWGAIAGNNALLTGSNVVDYRNQKVFAATHDIATPGWGLVTKIDQTEALQPLNRLKQLFTATLLLTAIVVTVLALVLTRMVLTRPLSKLLVGATRLKKGDFSKPVRVNSHDEIGELASTFNIMASRLHESYGTLEQKVRDATAELAKQLKQSESQNRQLEESKHAVLNILEDLNAEKDNAKTAVAKDEAILRSIGDGLIAFDSHGEVERVNEAAQKQLGYTEKQLLGSRYIAKVKATDQSGADISGKNRPVTQAITSKQTISTILYYKRKDGSTFPTQLTVAPIVINGKVVGAIETFRDITREKEIDKTKTEFVSLASHQLRTPLSTISWYAEMLLAGDAGKVTEEQSKYIEEIYSSNRRMTELVGSLLNVSRIEMGTFTVEPEPTDLVKLSQAIVKDLEPRIFARKIDFQEKYDPQLPSINVDPKLMRMVIENLASNAIKYTPEAGKVILQVERHDNEIQIVVSDTGFGIPKQQQHKIFSKLFRADNVKILDTEGTGLGLYLVKSIVDYSGGKIWFVSEEKKGTTFTVSLPINGMKERRGSKQLD